MKVSIENKQTYHSIAELVEGEAFLHCDAFHNDSMWIYVSMDEVDGYVTLLEVTHNGLITRCIPIELVLGWHVQPYEITAISFAPSTCRNHC